MRSPWRGLERSLRRDIAFLCLADVVVGISFGAIAVAGGLSPWIAVVLSLLVFAAGSQFAALAVVLSGGSALAAVITGLVLNLRCLPFGLAVADILAVSWPKRLLGSHLIIDETVAFVMNEDDLARRRLVYAAVGSGLVISWTLGTAIGVFAGQAIADPNALGLDAAAPMVLLALVLPVLRDNRALRAGLAGAVIALATTPVLPAGLPVLLGLFGLLASKTVTPRPTEQVVGEVPQP
jgi:predicted branched-subunit amino acid permease